MNICVSVGTGHQCSKNDQEKAHNRILPYIRKVTELQLLI